ncbi:MAG: BON domain-containing protein [Gemmataceae bacterium]
MPATASMGQAALALKQSSMPPLRKLKVEENDREVIISGEVSTYYLKQLAQETLMPVLEGRRLVNQVTVKPSGIRRAETR